MLGVLFSHICSFSKNIALSLTHVQIIQPQIQWRLVLKIFLNLEKSKSKFRESWNNNTKTILKNQSNTNFAFFKATCFGPEFDTHGAKKTQFLLSGYLNIVCIFFWTQNWCILCINITYEIKIKWWYIKKVQKNRGSDVGFFIRFTCKLIFRSVLYWLLKAMNPFPPLQKEICLSKLSHQSFTPVPWS